MKNYGKFKKSGKNIKCIMSNKIVRGKEVVIVEHAVDYVRKMGYLVISPKKVFLLQAYTILSVLFIFLFMSNFNMVSADGNLILSDCSIYGCRINNALGGSGQTIVVNQTIINQNTTEIDPIWTNNYTTQGFLTSVVGNSTYCLQNGTNCPTNTGNTTFNESRTNELYLKINGSNSNENITLNYSLSANRLSGIYNFTSANNYISFNGVTLTFNETKLNLTIVNTARQTLGNATDLNKTYGKFWYNMSDGVGGGGGIASNGTTNVLQKLVNSSTLGDSGLTETNNGLITTYTPVILVDGEPIILKSADGGQTFTFGRRGGDFNISAGDGALASTLSGDGGRGGDRNEKAGDGGDIPFGFNNDNGGIAGDYNIIIARGGDAQGGLSGDNGNINIRDSLRNVMSKYNDTGFYAVIGYIFNFPSITNKDLTSLRIVTENITATNSFPTSLTATNITATNYKNSSGTIGITTNFLNIPCADTAGVVNKHQNFTFTSGLLTGNNTCH